MTFNTKYSTGQVVYFLLNNEINFYEVTDIRIDFSVISGQKNVYVVGDHAFREDEIFESVEDLTKHLFGQKPIQHNPIPF